MVTIRGARHWTPDKPHLIVFDYVIGAEAEIGKMMGILAQRKADFKEKVRVLLVERQPWKRGGLHLASSSATESQNHRIGRFESADGQAEWFSQLNGASYEISNASLAHEEFRFESGIIELRKLRPDQLRDIVRQLEALDDRKIAESDKVIEATFERIDNAGRPLFAYFLAEALLDQTFKRDWDKSDILDYVLKKNRERRWAQYFEGEPPELGDDDPSIRLACLATMTDGLDGKLFEQESFPKSFLPDGKTFRQALALTEAPIGNKGRKGNRHIPPLQPDILGEWFVISALASEQMRNSVVDAAWRTAPDKMAEYLVKLTADFCYHDTVKEILDHEPAGETGGDLEYALISSKVASNLLLAKHLIPAATLEALCRAANLEDHSAMNILGIFYLLGQGGPQDDAKAVRWFRKAVDAGIAAAMFNLGIMYAKGQGVPQDDAEAVRWYRKAADAGETAAMRNLGLMYANGQGVPQDDAEAVRWFRKSADAGCADAMFHLGLCYSEGKGVELDREKAIFWMKQAAEMGLIEAVEFLNNLRDDQ